MKKIALLIMCCVGIKGLWAQPYAEIKTYSKAITTYPYSDPSVIADPTSNIYPYFRYDGFTLKPEQKVWKIIELENEYIKLTILPEIGGKIWSATEKKTGKDFIYNNHVVKFRDVAMRGPWTSGGIEANYGTIGHTPNCATPVDYHTEIKQDGSASCYIGVLDLLTQTTWRLEINLPKDKAYFTTNSTWFNNTPLSQPYYSWMNTGIKTTGNLEFIYPGTHYLGHDGEYHSWPINDKNGKKISFYNENNFGGYKSYHVFGTYTNFFGAYWHNDNYGMARYATHDDKPGKKIWIWGLSQQGMIWEKLLTDTDGQYAEVQSGRLLNQSSEKSMFSPFKFKSFAPTETDTWTEYWYPVLETNGFVEANNYGALNIQIRNGWLVWAVCPIQKMNETITVKTPHNTIEKQITLIPLQTYKDSVRISNNTDDFSIVIGDKILYNAQKQIATKLQRPIESPENFDWNNVYGLYLAGKSLMDQRQYAKAEEKIQLCLKLDENYLPALALLSNLNYRKMEYKLAFEVAQKALSINTYDPEANYNYALAAFQLNNLFDAKDGFDMATQSAAYRGPAFTQLALIHLKEKNYDKAIDYAQKALTYNALNIDALQALSVAYRITKNSILWESNLQKIKAIDPLNHFVHFEQYLNKPNEAQKQLFLQGLKSEMPAENCMQLAVWYYNIGCIHEVKTLLDISPIGHETAIWRTYYKSAPNQNRLTPSSAFPFRAETAHLLETIIKTDNSWKYTYDLALIYASKNNTTKAKQLFNACGNIPNEANFYATRANYDTINAINDLKRAIELDANECRYYKLLGQKYLSHNQVENALAIVEIIYLKNPNNYIMGMLYAKILLANKQYKLCDKTLANLNIIPFEGATEGRIIYWSCKLAQALEAMQVKNYAAALPYIQQAQLFPENLGAGKPYQESIDTRLEDWMNYICYKKTNNTKAANLAIQKIIQFNPIIDNTVYNFLMPNQLVTAWALEITQGRETALKWLDNQQRLYKDNAELQWCIQVFKNKQDGTKNKLPSQHMHMLLDIAGL